MIACKNCGKECLNIRGWKSHMSKSHGGWKAAELIDIAESASSEQGAAASGFETFEEAASAVASGEAAQPSGDQPKRKPRATKAQKQASEEILQELQSIRSEFTQGLVEIPDIILTQSMNLPPMGDGEKRAMQKAMEFPLRVLNVEFAVEPINVSLTSFWVTLMVPLMMFLTIVMSRVVKSTPGGPKDVRNAKQAGTPQAVRSIQDKPEAVQPVAGIPPDGA